MLLQVSVCISDSQVGTILPHRPLGSISRHCCGHNWERGCSGIWWAEAPDAANIPQCTGQSSQERHPAPRVRGADVEKTLRAPHGRAGQSCDHRQVLSLTTPQRLHLSNVPRPTQVGVELRPWGCYHTGGTGGRRQVMSHGLV